MNEQTYDMFYDQQVISSDGEKVGKIDNLYAPAGHEDKPVLATVATGWFGTKSSFFPLRNAEVTDDGVKVPYTKDYIKDAPSIDKDDVLSDEQSQELYDYYQLGSSDSEGSTQSSDENGDSMTLSEEQVTVGTLPVETGRYRLKKYVVTDHVTKTVPVQREEVRLEREPISGDTRQTEAGFSEGEQEVVTYAEEPVVSKNTVATERVGLTKETVTGETEVDTEVRREEIDVKRSDER